ncbi:MAG TPA: hypothetical protein VD932_02445 [Aquabacterium sp.]|nr:hypothetical protein [Aquabacterium sp.]
MKMKCSDRAQKVVDQGGDFTTLEAIRCRACGETVLLAADETWRPGEVCEECTEKAYLSLLEDE